MNVTNLIFFYKENESFIKTKEKLQFIHLKTSGLRSMSENISSDIYMEFSINIPAFGGKNHTIVNLTLTLHHSISMDIAHQPRCLVIEFLPKVRANQGKLYSYYGTLPKLSYCEDRAN